MTLVGNIESGRESDAISKKDDRVKGQIQVEQYASGTFGVDDFEISELLFDTLLVNLVDGNTEEKVKDGIICPTGATQGKLWRKGKVILAGNGCRTVKKGDYVLFPQDKGIVAKSIDVMGEGTLKDCIFIAEDRIFGIGKLPE